VKTSKALLEARHQIRIAIGADYPMSYEVLIGNIRRSNK